jgi:hypothetical protein
MCNLERVTIRMLFFFNIILPCISQILTTTKIFTLAILFFLL